MEFLRSFIGPCLHEPGDFLNRIFFIRIRLKALWRAVSKQCGFGVRIHWFRVDGRPIRVKRCAVSKMSRRIHVEVASGIISYAILVHAA